VFAENHRLFSIEFQLHANPHIALWLPVVSCPLQGGNRLTFFPEKKKRRKKKERRKLVKQYTI